MSHIAAEPQNWPPASAVDKTSVAMDWEASLNDSLGPEHHLELSKRVYEAWPSLWTWPGQCVWVCVCERGRAEEGQSLGWWIKGGSTVHRSQDKRRLDRWHSTSPTCSVSVSTYSKLSPEMAIVCMKWLMMRLCQPKTIIRACADDQSGIINKPNSQSMKLKFGCDIAIDHKGEV